MLLNDRQIKELVEKEEMISPFMGYKKEGKLSYGLDPFGYTLRLSNEFAYFKDNINQPLNPLSNDIHKTIEYITTDTYLLKPGEVVLGRSIEYIKMTEDVTGFAYTKSTYARLGVFANITTIDSSWEGFLTIEIANLGRNPVYIIANKGIAQLHFIKGEEADSRYNGKYQNLNEIKV